MSKTDLVYLKHMLDAIQQIEEYLEDISSERFLGTKLTQDGVIRQLEILGEASNQISDSTKRAYPHIPWGPDHWLTQQAYSRLFQHQFMDDLGDYQNRFATTQNGRYPNHLQHRA